MDVDDLAADGCGCVIWCIGLGIAAAVLLMAL